jgi:molybdopterin synthase catalytic subunit
MGTFVSIRYHAAARELTGVAEDRFDAAGPISGADLRERIAARHPRLAPILPRMRLAINEELGGPEGPVAAGDVVDVLPTVAGGSGSADGLVAIRDTSLSIDEAVAAVRDPGAGGIAIFVGVVRDHADGQPVARLDYEAHPTLAEKELRRVLERVASAHPGTRIAATHRIGTLAIGDAAVIVVASAAHRAEAFVACRAAIDAIKETVPIWKKEWSPDGDALWVNLGEPVPSRS